MSKIEFDKMKNSKMRKIYECMWGSKDFDCSIDNTIFRNKKSYNSYTFLNSNNQEDKLNKLIDIFDIKNQDKFREKFDKSCNGSGQETKNITILHSSALCALLFFYNVSEETPLKIEIEKKAYEFTHSCFEYQNKVIEGHQPSNVDIVLVGEESKSKQKVVLFLESKFSEYYTDVGKTLDKVSKDYLNNQKCNYSKTIYEKIFVKELYKDESKHENKFKLKSADTCYIGGIKQMISHYVGIRNLYNDVINKTNQNNEVIKALKDSAKIMLGEILFTKGIGQLTIDRGAKTTCLSSYEDKYETLAEILNKQIEEDGLKDKITVLSKVLSYSIFENNEYINSNIKKFYF